MLTDNKKPDYPFLQGSRRGGGIGESDNDKYIRYRHRYRHQD